jgi:N-acetylneuraminic acid mutarotase
MNTETWVQVPSLPNGKERQYACAFSYENSGFVFGGSSSNALNDLWRYDVFSNSWFEMAPKPGMGLSGASCFVISNKAYFIGGANQQTNASKEVWCYNISLDTWQKKMDFPFNGLWRATAVSCNGKGYLIFGRDSIGSFNKQLMEYNDSLDTWTVINTYSGNGRVYASMVTAESNLVLFGGVDSLNNYSNKLEYFDFNSNSWIAQNPLPAQGRKGGMCFTNYDNLYYTTGIDSTDTRLGQTWKVTNPTLIYDNNSERNAQLFTNPFENEIKLSTKNDSEILIYDIHGKLIAHDSIKKEHVIDSKNIINGVYFLKIQAGNKIIFFKIVK